MDQNTALLIAVLGAAALLMLAHRQGLRLNIGLAKRVARELTEALDPEDVTYTWIGGGIGFHATYELSGGRMLKATATFLPRHSPMYMPVAKLLSGHDKLQLTLELDRPVEGEAHLFEPKYLRRRFADAAVLEGLDRGEPTAGAWPFSTFSSDPSLAGWARDLAESLEPGLPPQLKHVALTGGETPTLYFLLVPRPHVTAKAARAVVLAAEALPEGP